MYEKRTVSSIQSRENPALNTTWVMTFALLFDDRTLTLLRREVTQDLSTEQVHALLNSLLNQANSQTVDLDASVGSNHIGVAGPEAESLPAVYDMSRIISPGSNGRARQPPIISPAQTANLTPLSHSSQDSQSTIVPPITESHSSDAAPLLSVGHLSSQRGSQDEPAPKRPRLTTVLFSAQEDEDQSPVEFFEEGQARELYNGHVSISAS